MGVFTPNTYPVVLAHDQRERLDALTRTGKAPAGKVRPARVLLLADRGRPGGRRTRSQIAAAPGVHVNTVDRLRKRFVVEGEEPALNRKVRVDPPTPPKLDGRVQAHRAALGRSPAPEGRARWTLTLPAGEWARRRLATSISVGTVRQGLKKMS